MRWSEDGSVRSHQKVGVWVSGVPEPYKGVCYLLYVSYHNIKGNFIFFFFFWPGFFFNPFTMENLKYESRWVNVLSTHVLITQSQEPKTPSPSHLALPVSCCSIFKQTPYIIFSIYILVCISKQTKDTERFSWFLNYHDFSFFFSVQWKSPNSGK